ncbi:MAG: phosphatidylserine decarboxylase family protein, partial [Bacteroidetes bacterium]|nr:phosphatidylserine decarboxylase family protein [Bacteroidota bacterium]
MKISREGYFTIFLVNLVISAVVIGLVLLDKHSYYLVLVPLLLIELLIVYFFRDPDREIPRDEDAVVSPADGKVVLIQPVQDEFVGPDSIQISIFLSVFNVHVNRYPITGTVKLSKYVSGKFLAAFNHDASVKNEQTVIGLEGAKGTILFKQIAGLLARRIVFYRAENIQVMRGDRCGIIKFGSS